MKVHHSFFVLLFILIGLTKLVGQSVVINELMSKNGSTIKDVDGDYNDWIELYNKSDESVSLYGWYLSDDDNLMKWQLPNIDIGPNAFVVIFASGKDKSDVDEWHTNFKISADGESISLSNSNGELQDRTEEIALGTDQSFGRTPDGDGIWVVSDFASPFSPNNASSTLLFSHSPGFYESAFSLEVMSSSEDEIYYTTDGTEPSEMASRYNGGILLEPNTSSINMISNIETTPAQEDISYQAWEHLDNAVARAWLLRFATFRDGVRTSKIYTRSYFVGDDMNFELPVISISVEPDDLFDYDKGIYVPGVHFNESNKEFSGNYFEKGRDWEKPANVEYFEINGQLAFSHGAGLRIHGGKTRQAAQKSLRLYARAEYGSSHFNYPLLPNREVDEYKRILLRTSMSSWTGETILHDVIWQQICKSLNFEYQEFQPVVVYINGEYWGVQTLRDRLDENYIEYLTGVNNDDVSIVNWSFEPNNFAMNHDLSVDVNYEQIKELIDIDNYIDYNIAEQFIGNYDWPANNTKLWKEQPNGRWRWMLYDVDGGYRDINYNMLDHCTNTANIDWPNPPSSTILFRGLMANDSFRTQFVNRYVELLNTTFHPDTMLEVVDEVVQKYESEIDRHIARWNYPVSKDQWYDDIDQVIKYFLKERPCAVRSNIINFFNLDTLAYDCVIADSVITSSTSTIVAPIPSNGDFFIFTSSGLSNVDLELLDSQGRRVFMDRNVDILPQDYYYFYLNQLPTGVYFLRIWDNSEFEMHKVLIN